jgi:hypothetical protein
VNPPVLVVVPPGAVTVTVREPFLALLLIVISAVIRVELTTAILLTVIPAPKLTVEAPVRLVPLMVMVRD